MKKILLYSIFFSSIIISCKKENSEQEAKLIEPKIIVQLNNILNQKAENNLLENKLAKDASKIYLSFVSQENSLEDYPFVYEAGMEAENGYSWVKFRTAMYESEFSEIGKYKNYERVSFQLLGKMNNEEALKLKENTPYLISGKMIEKGWKGKENYYLYDFPSFIDGKLYFDNITYKISNVRPLNK
jgi:hypothetical protein